MLSLSPEPLDSVPGFEVLDSATSVRLYFPAIRKGWSLLIAVEPVDRDAGTATESIRWASLDALLGTLNTVVGPDATAFVMPVTATKPWTLDIDLGKSWRLRNVAITFNQRDFVNLLRSRSNWDFVDDRFTQAPVGTSTKISLEVS